MARPPPRPRQQEFREVQQGYLPGVLDEIEELALIKAGRKPYSYRDVAEAFGEYFGHLPPLPARVTVASFLQDNLFILLCAVMTLVFGGMGLYPIEGKPPPAGFLDIAKIFAGAMVGGAAGKVQSAAEQGRRNKANPARPPKIPSDG
jgi:hypothetical protein